MNIKSLGEKTIHQLVDKKIICFPYDLYSLKASTLMKLEGMGKKSILNLLSAIDKSKNVTLERFIFSLGIPDIGETLSKLLAQTFHTLENIKMVTVNKLITINDIGKRTAHNIIEMLKTCTIE